MSIAVILTSLFDNLRYIITIAAIPELPPALLALIFTGLLHVILNAEVSVEMTRYWTNHK